MVEGQAEQETSMKLAASKVYSSTMNMKAICFSETYVGFHGVKRRYIPEDRINRSHRCNNLKSDKSPFLLVNT
jgi:hypothetical protein